MNSWFSPQKPQSIVIPILGIFLTFICFLLELRTHFLLAGLGARGLQIETKMKVNKKLAFFEYMNEQDIREDLPDFHKNIL